MSRQFEVFPYSADKLRDLFVEKSLKSSKKVEEKVQYKYFKDYLHSLDAQTVCVESNYIDHDYLEDFAEYYVKCFNLYSRACVRLHFFNLKFTIDDFSSVFTEENTSSISRETLQNAYLGFIIIKPLPKTIIGKTCLKTHPSNNGRKSFPITRVYHANLWGCFFPVETLAFQEQDSVAAACATSALWSVFQGTGKLFQHSIPSPVEITKAATDNFPLESRALPSKGLNAAQMGHAIRKVGLEPLLVASFDIYTLQGVLYAYLRGKIPVILALTLYDTLKEPNEEMGLHAVAVAGYSCGDKDISTEEGNDRLQLVASKIDKIYVHDDQVGPFARMEIDGKKVSVRDNGKDIKIDSLSTLWRGANTNEEGDRGSGRAVPLYVLVPLYHKIRIPYGCIYSAVYKFNNYIELLKKEKVFALSGNFEWEIYLSTVNDFKNSIISERFLYGEACKIVLVEPMPRFLWLARAMLNGEPAFELVFDATDIEQGSFFIRAVIYNVKIPFEGIIELAKQLNVFDP